MYSIFLYFFCIEFGSDIKYCCVSQLEDIQGNFTLHRKLMNIHHFNVSKENVNQSLHIVVDLETETKGRLFPVILLIR